MEMIDKDKVTVPEGKVGNWEVKRFSVNESESMWSFFGGKGRGVPPGNYTELTRSGKIIMSDTPDEIRDHTEPIYRAKGACLINGLGLGVVLQAVARKQEVTKVIVVEKAKEVIDLVSLHYLAMFPGKIEVVHADAFEWKPPKGLRFNMIWHDLWDDICADNLPEMERLHRKYGRRTDWQGSWCRWRCERGR